MQGCLKEFSCEAFGTKGNYSGYAREMWEMCSHQVQCSSDFKMYEKKYGVRYSELLGLAYFAIVEYHVVDPMHNLLLGYLLTMWNLDKNTV